MTKMKKVFIGGSLMSGKNILWRLLDGHPNLVVAAAHASIGYSLMSENADRFFSRGKPATRRERYKYLPSFTLKSPSGARQAIELGEYYRALYSFSGYGALRSWSKGNSLFVNPSEGRNIRFPFHFDFGAFESQLEKALFYNQSTFSEDELLQEIYQAYVDNDLSIGDKEKITTFVDTLPNGLDPIRNLLSKVAGAKILVMTRDSASLAYANAKRIASYQSELDENMLRRIMFTQDQFIKKSVNQRSEFFQLSTSFSQVKVIEFSDLLQSTEKTMREVAEFLEIVFDRGLVSATVGGKPIADQSVSMIGKINDDPVKNLSKQDLDLIRYMAAEYDEGAKAHEMRLYLRAVGWKLRSSKLAGYIRRHFPFLAKIKCFIEECAEKLKRPRR
jgi:hypothetical protein